MKPLVALVIALTTACIDLLTPARTVPVSADVTSAPQQVMVGGKAVTLAAEAWRNLMPGGGRTDRRLVVTLNFSTVDRSSWPTGISAQRAWVIHNGEAWVISDFETRETSSAGAIQLLARGGPLWANGDAVDVVVELRDATGATVRVKSPGTTVQTVV